MGGSEFSHKKEGVGKVREGEGELEGGGWGGGGCYRKGKGITNYHSLTLTKVIFLCVFPVSSSHLHHFYQYSLFHGINSLFESK